MPDTPILLSTLLAETRSAIDAAVAASAADRDDGAMVESALTMLGGAVDQGVRDACNQDLGALLVKGWSMASELYGYTDAKKYPPAQIVRMALADHTMKIAVDPELSLTIAAMPVHKLKLIVEFSAEIIAAVLIIQAGAITAFELGSVRLSAKVLWGAVALPLKLKTHDVTIPGRVRIDPPVAIRTAPPPQDS